MRITSIEKTDIIRALEISSRYEDQDFSLEDRISFVLMERLGRFQVWTYDHDFAVFRFGADRKQAFEILQ